MAKKRIFLFDEDKETLDCLTGFLSDKGLDALAIGESEEMISRFEEHNIDLAIISVTSDEVNALELLQRIKQSRPMCHVFLLTRAANASRIMELMENGASDFFIKPISDESEAFTEAVSAALEKTARWRSTFGWKS